jgi:hypothetical protein
MRPMAVGKSNYSQAANLAADITRRTTTRTSAVAELALIAPHRPDLIEETIHVINGGRATPGYKPLGDWPPRAIQVTMLAAARRVTLGHVALVGPHGYRVEMITLDRHDGYGPRPYLRLTQYGKHVADLRTVDELTRYLNVSTLEEEPPSAGGNTSA